MQGIHHLGLAVSNLSESCAFFCELLGWQKVGENPDYPAIFVSNNKVMFTLWQTDNDANSFDRKKQVGLHHVALTADSEQELYELYQKLENSGLAEVEFPPELIRDGPAKHMMCYEPSGIRVEFIWPGNGA